MYCPKCRTALPDNARFCGACGLSLSAGPSAPPPNVAPPPPQQPAYAAYQQAPQYAPQPVYGQPQGQMAPVVGVGSWLGTMFVTVLPIVGIVMLFVWAFGSNSNPNRSNWAKAALVLTLISVVVWVAFLVVAIAVLGWDFERMFRVSF